MAKELVTMSAEEMDWGDLNSIWVPRGHSTRAEHRGLDRSWNVRLGPSTACRSLKSANLPLSSGGAG